MDPETRPGGPKGSVASIAAPYAVTLVWILSWFALRPPERPNLFFREGGPIDLLSSIWLLSASILLGLTFLGSRGSALRSFWLTASIGLLFLGIDERFQGHELLSETVTTPVPFGMRNWNDVAVSGYAVVALGLVIWRFPLLWRARRLRWLGIVACGLAGISTAIDSTLKSSVNKDLWEESCKILSAAGLFTVALEAFSIEARRAQAEGAVPAREGWGMRLALTAVVAVVAFAVLGGDLIEGAFGIEDEAWSDRMGQNWGSPHSWVVCALLWVASILLMLAHQLRASTASGRASLYMSVYLFVLGIGEGLRATRFRTEDDLVAGQFPATFAAELTFMHDPLELPGTLFLISAAACSLTLLRSLTRADSSSMPGESHRPLVSMGLVGPSVAGLTLLAIALVINEVGGRTVNAVHAPALRITGGTLLLLAAVHQLLLQLRAPTRRG